MMTQNPYTPPQGAYSGNKNVLWILPPKRFSAQARRPLIYQFDQALVERANEALCRSVKSSGSTKHAVLDVLNTPEAMTAVMPSYDNFTLVNLDPLSNNYTFILSVVNEMPTGTINTVINPMRASQTLYYGYFIDEPYNPIYHGATPTINPNASLMITHVTQANKNTSWAPQGSMDRVDVAADFDVINPNTLNVLTQTPTYLMTPHMLNASVDVYGGQVTDVLSETYAMTSHTDPVTVTSSLQDPRTNLKHIIDAVVNTNDTIFAESHLGGMGSPDMSGVFGSMASDDYTTHLSSNLQNGVERLRVAGLQPNQMITMGLIASRYDPEVVPCIGDMTSTYGVSDQTIKSKTNSWSSLLCSVIPGYLANAGIATLSFQYNSHLDQFSPTGRIEGLMQMTDQDLMTRALAVIKSLKQRIFAPMIQQHGPFILSGMFTNGGVTSCLLNFLSDSIPQYGYYEVPSILGGCNNSLLGDVRAATHNGTELALFLSGISGDGRPFEEDPIIQYGQYPQQTSILGNPPISNQPFNQGYAPAPTPPHEGFPILSNNFTWK